MPRRFGDRVPTQLPSPLALSKAMRTMNYAYCCRSLAAYFFTRQNLKAWQVMEDQKQHRQQRSETRDEKLPEPEMEPIAYEPEPGEHVYTCYFLLPRDPKTGSLLQPGTQLKLHTPLGEVRTAVVCSVQRFQRYRVGTVTLVVHA